MQENLKYILTLTIICLVTASLLSGVYFLTRPKILAQKAQSQKEALEKVMPEAGYFEQVSPTEQLIYYKAYTSADKKKLLGFAFLAQAKGYSSVIETMAGVDRQGKITGISILAQNETPGLGAKIAEVVAKKTLWEAIKELFRPKEEIDEISEQPWFCTQFKGKRIEDLVVVTQPTRENVQAITGATVSSEALTDSVREKAKEILSYER